MQYEKKMELTENEKMPEVENPNIFQSFVWRNSCF